jgi:hypothetical protein
MTDGRKWARPSHGFRAAMVDGAGGVLELDLVRDVDVIEDGQRLRRWKAFGPPYEPCDRDAVRLDPEVPDVQVVVETLTCPCPCGREVFAPAQPLPLTVN